MVVMNVKRIVLAFVLVLFVTAFVSAEQLTTIGIIDISKVYNAFYRESQGVREFEQQKKEYQSEIDMHVNNLNDLKDRRARAAQRGDQQTVDQLDKEIFQKTQFIEDLTRRRREQLQQKQSQLITNDFLKKLQQAIVFVAESQGYTIVMRTDAPSLQWWSPTVDISDLVLERLRQVAGQ